MTWDVDSVREFSCSLLSQCLAQACTPDCCNPRMVSYAVSPAKKGSAPKLSQFLPPINIEFSAPRVVPDPRFSYLEQPVPCSWPGPGQCSHPYRRIRIPCPCRVDGSAFGSICVHREARRGVRIKDGSSRRSGIYSGGERGDAISKSNSERRVLQAPSKTAEKTPKIKNTCKQRPGKLATGGVFPTHGPFIQPTPVVIFTFSSSVKP